MNRISRLFTGRIYGLLLIAGFASAHGFAESEKPLEFEDKGRIKGLQGSYISVVHRGAEYQFFGNVVDWSTPGLTLASGTSRNEVGPTEIIAPNSVIDDLLTPEGEPDPQRMMSRPVVRYSEKESRYYAVVYVARGYPPKDGRVYPAMLVSKTDDPRQGWTYLGQFKGDPEKAFGPPKTSWTGGMAFLLNDAAGDTVDHGKPLANRFVLYNEFGGSLKLLYSQDGREWFFFRDAQKNPVEIQPAAFRSDGAWTFSSMARTPAGYFMFVSYRWTDRGPTGHRFLHSQDGLEWVQLEEYPQGPKNYSLDYDAAQDVLCIMPTVVGRPPYAKDLYLFKPSTLVDRKGPVDVSAFDTRIRPQNDLYEYVNGTWLKETPIPSDKSNYGAFIKLDDLSRERVRKVVEQAATESAPAGSDTRKVGDFHRAFMDTERVTKLGFTPLEPLLDQIAGLSSHDDVARMFGAAGPLGIGSPIGHFVDIDGRNSTRHLTTVVQAGTTLPDRDYYLENGEKEKAARAALVAYADRLAQLTGDTTADPGETVLGVEKKLAEIQWPRVELRDAIKTYNKFPAAEFAATIPHLRWATFAEAAGTPGITELNVATPSYFEKLDGLFPTIDVATWKTWLRFKLLDAYASFLSPDFERAHFDFHSRAIGGIQEELPRWKRSVDAISGKGAGDFGALGDVLGRLYVKEHFTHEAKARMDELVKNLLAAFGSSIDELEWMTPATKARAKDKLAKITTKIGYPRTWRSYDGLDVRPNDLVGNVMRSRAFEHARNVAKLGKPVDREEWGMTPQTVNAYYNPSLNEIVFPAAILQPPFFDVDAPDALNYGGIGGVIGHEISHAFDDQGSRYDGDGNLENWWTDADRAAFEALTKRLVEQYSSYEPLPGRKVKGEFTLGENIADLSGLAVAYKAFQLAKRGKEPEKVQGWTSNQLFFVGWSRVWQRKYREDDLVRRLLTDPHSPSRYRANGPVSNLDGFYEAFQVKEGDALWKPVKDRIRIW